MKRHLTAAILLLAVMAIGWFVHARSGAARTIARVTGSVVAPPAGQRGWVAWIETTPDGSRLMASRSGRRPRALLSEPGLSGLAVTNATALVNRSHDRGGDLLAVDLATGEHQVLAPTIGDVTQIVAGDGVVYWLENRGAAVPGAPFVVAAGPAALIRSAPETGGAPSLVAIISIGEPPLVRRTAGISGPVDLLGVASAAIYWADRRSTGTDMETSLRRCAPAGRPETLAVETGTQAAALTADRVAWTAFSQEAQIPQQYVAVKQRPLDHQQTDVIADWLDAGPVLLAEGTRLYAQRPDGLWALGHARGRQRVIAGGVGAFLAATVVGDTQYLVRREADGAIIAQRPLTWWARARRVFGG